MRNTLFRPEAVNSSLSTLFGERVFFQPLSLRFMLGFLASVFTATLLFAALVPVNQTERVRGYVTPAKGEVKVYSARSGVLAAVHVEEGQPVRQGDVLATLFESGFNEHGVQASASLQHYVEEQIAQMTDRIHLLKERNQQVRVQLEARARTLSTESQLLWDEAAMAEKRLELATQEYQASLELYERGAISQHEHNQSQAARHVVQQQVSSSRLAAASRTAAWKEAERQLTLQPLTEAQEELELQTSLSQLRQRREELRLQGHFTIAAPIDGVVGQLTGVPGEPLDSRAPFAVLMPEEQGLEARLYLPSRTMAEIAVGQRVLLAYDAYPYQRYGMFEAVLESLAPVPLDPREHLLPFELYEPVYLAKARLLEQTIIADGVEQSYPLRSGLLLSAEIVTGRQTLMQKALSPLASVRSRL